MKTLIAAVILAIALIAAPALAQLLPAANSVTVGGKAIGADPDANVRLQLMRDAGSEGL
jgi:hypothetical protein